jgi:hypothetical protein
MEVSSRRRRPPRASVNAPLDPLMAKPIRVRLAGDRLGPAQRDR